jgi:predicted ester cyclase
VSTRKEAANKRVVWRIYHEVLNQEAYHLIPELFSPGVIDHRRLPGLASGLDNILAGARLNRTAFPDLVFTVDDLAAEGSLVFARWTMRGTHRGEYLGRPPTGRAVEWCGVTQFRLVDGRVAERWLYADDAALLALIAS